MSIRQTLRSSAIYIAIAVITATITLVSFANKALTYQDQVGNVVLKVHKKEFKVTAQTTGTIAEVRADVGQSVKQGDVIAVITNPVLDKQIAKLSELSATNASASVQLVSLQTQKEAQSIYAPTDGVVSEVVSAGEAVNTLEKVAVMYADSGVKLEGTFSLDDYARVQGRLGALSVSDRRLASDFPVTYVGLAQQVKNTQQYESSVILYFAPSNQDDGRNLLQDEQIILRLAPKQNGSKPIDYILNWYRSFLDR